ncbi:MAG: ABC transporter substrate-binding protein [Candidatus Dormibacteraeota bacterium]|nr:ABC transporter substrate-binding protein [Candidatus Dormibacteraeota bacterium]
MRHTGPGRPGGARRWQSLLAAAAGLLVAVACGGTGGGGQQATGSPIKIGVLSDHAPITAVEGAEMTVNTDLAVSQINAAGGINGHKLQVVYADPKAQPDEAVTLAQQLVQQQGVQILVGGVLSSECLGVENLVPRLKVAYMASTGCAAEDFTSKQCNNYSFRTVATGRQVNVPLAQYITNTYGKKWGIIYPDYALGQSQLATYKSGLTEAGGQLTQVIPIPQNETNMTPYITKIATDGSINGLINAEVGADLVRASQSLAQFNINQKMPIVGVFGKERFGGVYPPSLTGDIGQGPELAADQNQYSKAYHEAFTKQLAKEDSSIVNTLGGADKATAGDLGYEAYTAINALKLAIKSSNFSTKSDTNKLIDALASLNVKRGPEFPGGDFQMGKTDHQGATTTYIAKINGQDEQVLSTVAPNKLPKIGSCNVQK